MSKSSSLPLVLAGVVLAVCGASAHAQQPMRRASLSDFVAAQRAALEAEVVKADLEASRMRQQAMPAPASPPPDKLPKIPVFDVPAEPKPALLGVMSVGDQRVAEISLNGRTSLVATGQTIPDSQWRVTDIRKAAVSLVRPAKADSSKTSDVTAKGSGKTLQTKSASTNPETLVLSLMN